MKPSWLPWMRKGGCRKVLPGCRCLALVRFTSIRLALICFALGRFAAFARQLAVSPQGDQPSRCGGASAPTVTALFEWGEHSLVTSSAAMGQFARDARHGVFSLAYLRHSPINFGLRTSCLFGSVNVGCGDAGTALASSAIARNIFRRCPSETPSSFRS